MHLMFMRGDIISNKECEIRLKTHVKPNHICMLPPKSTAPAVGDSGGPLMLEFADAVQIGVLSGGHKSGSKKGYPLIYTRLTGYISWINEITAIH